MIRYRGQLYRALTERTAADAQRDAKYQKKALSIAKAIVKALKKVAGRLRTNSSEPVYFVRDYTQPNPRVIVDVSRIAPTGKLPIELHLTTSEDLGVGAASGAGTAEVFDGKGIIELAYFNDEIDVHEHIEGEERFDLKPFESTLVHELIHVLDGFRFELPPNKYDPGDLYSSDYFNDPVEFNAYFQEGAAAVWKDFKTWTQTAKRNPARLDYIEQLLAGGFFEFLSTRDYYWSDDFTLRLEPKTQRKFKLRMYQFYQYLLDHADKLWLQLTGKTYRETHPQRTARTATLPEYLYHITLVRNLDSIDEAGLQPGRSQNWPGYAHYAAGKVFLTEGPAVRGWIHKITYSAGMDSDYPVQEGFIPVVLRVKRSAVPDAQEDAKGSGDVRSGRSYFVEEPVDPDDLEVYTPWGWEPLDEDHRWTLTDYALETANKEVEDGEELVLLNEHVFLPEDLG
jgi:hypothetical protein